MDAKQAWDNLAKVAKPTGKRPDFSKPIILPPSEPLVVTPKGGK